MRYTVSYLSLIHIFILATTEAHKIPITILSRCQRYDFHRITIDTIADRLAELADKEAMDVEDKALRLSLIHILHGVSAIQPYVP